MPGLVELDPMVLPKTFIFRQCIFAVLLIIFLLKWAGPLIGTNLKPLYPRMLWANFD